MRAGVAHNRPTFLGLPGVCACCHALHLWLVVQFVWVPLMCVGVLLGGVGWVVVVVVVVGGGAVAHQHD
jgi:hypothetical protein